MQTHLPLLLLGGLLSAATPTWAGLLGTDFLFECPQCTPATAEHFIGKAGPGDYALKGDGYTWDEVDVEASTISIKVVVEGYTRSPLIFRLTWSPADYHLLNATASPSSTFMTGYSWGPGELMVDMGDQYFVAGSQITFDLTAATVPEPSAWLLGLMGAAMILWRRERRRPAACQC
ncbi:MYXO-CTERM domain-containing protein [Pelomonas aquatica]|uniref:MYXO-CTERM domain-containing protein n=1 Tax=Pelomonas aquatica TaxID=431058 RepID=A0ABU1Z9X9_9BURK|nr:PEP-CTERM sorting domain-containing protein [Pelomonas aquatica]MDR7297424.1 MYXO-CTERM domain-containing protein [Pelomonas aquatica]